ncbi:hypothetical protein D1224_02560 [Henriciella barbarensis]|uniref:Uncharacterized protein n=2 Tax=Henriciella barbarensis TaxID=86342 RepID=A0A399R3D3_9PROT|nr:hypothetical protein D1224_02560 [Henriciella barbarensis]
MLGFLADLASNSDVIQLALALFSNRTYDDQALEKFEIDSSVTQVADVVPQLLKRAGKHGRLVCLSKTDYSPKICDTILERHDVIPFMDSECGKGYVVNNHIDMSNAKNSVLVVGDQNRVKQLLEEVDASTTSMPDWGYVALSDALERSLKEAKGAGHSEAADQIKSLLDELEKHDEKSFFASLKKVTASTQTFILPALQIVGAIIGMGS